MKIFSKLILIILLTSCDDSHNTNTEEMENALSNMYWTIQSGTVSNVPSVGLSSIDGS